MGKSDVEMEDAGKHDHDSGNNVEESQSNGLGAKTEIKGENSPCAVTVTADANKSENGVSNEENSMIAVKSEIEDRTNNTSERNERMNLEGFMGEQTNTNSNNDERSITKPELEEETAAVSLVEKHAVANTEVVEQNTTNGVVKEDKSPEDGVEGGNPVKDVIEENPIGDASVERSKCTGTEDGGCVEHVATKELTNGNAESGSDHRENGYSQTELSLDAAPQSQNAALSEVLQGGDVEMEDASKVIEDKTVNNEPKEHDKEIILASPVTDGNAKNVEAATKQERHDSLLLNQPEATTPSSRIVHYPAKTGDRSEETGKTVFTQAALPQMAEGDDGTPEDQAAFMKELETFYRERAIDFKPPKFYGQPLNCLKLWRAVIRLGGYDRVTGSKLWRQVGESFHPPKTCTTVSWTFRIFYEKSLRDYETHKIQSGDLPLPVAMVPEASGADCEENGYQGAGSGRARRDAASRAMQGWHAQRLFGGEVEEPVIKDKNLNNTAKREKNVKSSLKQKRPNEMEQIVKFARAETSKQLVTSVVDVGPPADWVKINVRQMEDCFEVYALVPGLLREEVRVQSDPAGRLVITGQPEQVENPWGVTPFKKVVSLPLRIDPLKTSAVVSLHGRLFVRVPFELSNT